MHADRPRGPKSPVSARGPAGEDAVALVERLIDTGAGFALAGHVTREEGLMAAVIGGLVAGFRASGTISDLRGFLNTVTTENGPCQMMRNEALSLFKRVSAGEAVAELKAEEDPLPLLAAMIVEHPLMEQPRNLFRVMPREAAELGAATGVLVSLTVCRFVPELAAHILASAPDAS